MAIGIVSGLTNRLAGLVQVWSDYRDLYDRKAAAEQAAALPPKPLDNPQQALPHPHRGSRWFAAFFPRLAQRRSAKPNASAAALAREHLHAPGIPGDGPDGHKIVEAVPGNSPEGLPIQPYKVTTLRTGDGTEAQETASPLLKREFQWMRCAENLSDAARKSIGQRLAVLLWCERQQGWNNRLGSK